MFSDHLKKVDDAPQKTLFIIAACLVLVCQLLAMVMVVDGQVRKAELRDAHDATERLAIAQCIENSNGFARHSCVQQSQARSSNERLALALANADLLTLSEQERYSDGAHPSQMLSSSGQGLISASFAAR